LGYVAYVGKDKFFAVVDDSSDKFDDLRILFFLKIE
jgi:hypothetical protein